MIDTVTFAIDANNDTINGSTTSYYNPYAGTGVDGTEATRQGVIPITGVVKNLFVRTATTQGAGGSLVFTVRLNGVSTALTLTVAAGATAGTFSNTTNSFNITAGDLISHQVVNNAATTSAQIRSIVFIVERTY